MESNRNGVINIDISNVKNNDDDIINEMITPELISKLNSTINSLLSKAEKENYIPINNRKIYLFFMNKYFYSRNLRYILKQYKSKISNNMTNKNFYYLYSFTLFYIYFDYEYKKSQLFDLKLLTIDDFFKLIHLLYKSKLLSIQNTVDIFKFYLLLMLEKKNISMNEKINTLNNFIKYFWKISKDIDTEENNKEINELIKKEILEKFFNIINGTQDIYSYLYLLHSFRKEENIFLLIRMIVERKFLSKENKELIETNIINFLKNNFRKEHLNYFYKIISKILIKFNNLKPNQTKIKDENKSLNQGFTYLTKIIDIIVKVIQKEKNQINDNSCFYCDKGFAFNIDGKDKIGFKVKNILYSRNKKSVFCLLFSFLLRNNTIKDENQLIFSLNDSDKEYIGLYVKSKKLYLRYYSKKFYEIKLLDDVIYNNQYLFFFFYDKDQIKVSINNSDIYSQKDGNFKISNNFQVLVGSPENVKNIKKPEYSFNGIIYPIILLELNKKTDLYSEIKSKIMKVKNSYYLIAEKYFNNKTNSEYKQICSNYKEYYGLYEELENEENINLVLDCVNNIILYINPYVIINAFSKKLKIYKDYNFYEIKDEKNNKQYSYEFSVVPHLENGQIFAFKDNNIISFFRTNNGLNFILLGFEVLYNYILLINNNMTYMETIKDKNNGIFEIM